MITFSELLLEETVVEEALDYHCGQYASLADLSGLTTLASSLPLSRRRISANKTRRMQRRTDAATGLQQIVTQQQQQL